MTLRILCVLAGLVGMAAAADPAPLDPSVGYLAASGGPSGSQTLFAPWHVWASEAGDVLQNTTAASQEECAELCWQDPDCALFDYRTCANEVRLAAAACNRTWLLRPPVPACLPSMHRCLLGASQPSRGRRCVARRTLPRAAPARPRARAACSRWAAKSCRWP